MGRKAPNKPPGNESSRPLPPPPPPPQRLKRCCCCTGCGYQPDPPVGEINPPPLKP